MKKTAAKSLVAFFLLASAAAYADDGLVRFYDDTMIQITIPMSGGITLMTRGVASDISFGVSPIIGDRLSSYDESKVFLDSYRRRNKSGNMALWSGLGIELGGVVYTLTAFGSTENVPITDPRAIVSLSVITTGVVIEVIGAMLVSKSMEDILNAVNSYNRNAIAGYGE